MRTRHADRLWMIGGLVVIVLLAAVSYVLLVTPRLDEAAELKEQTGIAHDQATDLRNRIVQLKADEAKLDALRTALAARQAALPADSGVPAFLRQLQAAGSQVGVDVSGFTVSSAEEDEAGSGVWSLPIQLTAEGSAAQLGDFLNQLQGGGQKRAVLIESAALSSDESAAGGALSLALSVKAFVAPPVGAGAPVVTTD
ncbi:MAG: type 4a pilus biogenesis protein PilO [Actinoplanes sp.]